MQITSGLPANSVRDPEYAETDESRAQDILERIMEAAETDSEIRIDGCDASELISMLKSREYLAIVAKRNAELTSYYACP
jgi:hypothetical protein